MFLKIISLISRTKNETIEFLNSFLLVNLEKLMVVTLMASKTIIRIMLFVQDRTSIFFIILIIINDNKMADSTLLCF